MNEKTRLLIGGIGALVPIAANLLVVDFEGLAVGFSWFKIIGYVVKAAVLFGLGALIVYFHPKEMNRLKLFQLGLGAPALILSVLNGASVQHAKGAEAADAGTPSAALELPFEGTAYALEPPQAPPGEGQAADTALKTFALPRVSAAQQFWSGLTGQPERRVWFVVAHSEPKPEDARAYAAQLNAKYPTFKAEVYRPYKPGGSFSVVIGANLELAEAQALREKAIEAGLPAETRLWTFPRQQPKE